MNLEELLNREPRQWGKLSSEDLVSDIGLLQDVVRGYEYAILEDALTKERLLRIIEDKELEINRLKQSSKVGK
ncbi:hypothetical protein [Bacillus infantis]|uniref:hypothetical protein n=1 Tax=Bacillus infantis TaxID=324767 RepID=UPI003CF97DB0